MGSMNFNICARRRPREGVEARLGEALSRRAPTTTSSATRSATSPASSSSMGKGHGTRFEFECYDVGHLYNLAYCLDRKIVEPPLFVQTIFGILGGIGAEPRNLMFMKETADRLFGDDYVWSVLAAGRHQMAFTHHGRHPRRQCPRRAGGQPLYRQGQARAVAMPSRSRKIRRILEELSLEIATPAEARADAAPQGRRPGGVLRPTCIDAGRAVHREPAHHRHAYRHPLAGHGPTLRSTDDQAPRVDLPKMQRGRARRRLLRRLCAAGPAHAGGLRARRRERALAHAGRDQRHGPAPRTASTARVTTTADEIEAAHRDGVLAVDALRGERARDRRGSRRCSRSFRAMGARYLTLTHNGHNALADSCNPRTDLGDARDAAWRAVSELGREAVAELNRLGMLVDIVACLAAGDAAGGDSSRKTPVLATHSCVRALCDHAAQRRRRCSSTRCAIAAAWSRSPPCRASCKPGGKVGRGDGRRLLSTTSTTRCSASGWRMSGSARISTAAAGSPAGATRPRART